MRQRMSAHFKIGWTYSVQITNEFNFNLFNFFFFSKIAGHILCKIDTCNRPYFFRYIHICTDTSALESEAICSLGTQKNPYLCELPIQLYIFLASKRCCADIRRTFTIFTQRN